MVSEWTVHINPTSRMYTVFRQAFCYRNIEMAGIPSVLMVASQSTDPLVMMASAAFFGAFIREVHRSA